MKRCKLIAALLLVLLVAALCASCTPAKVEEPEVTVTVNGKEVTADGTVYAISFANDVTRAVVEATTTKGEIRGTGTFDLKEGENEFALTLTANGKETALTVKVMRAAAEKPADTSLSEVKAGDTVLSVTGGKYTAVVEYETDKVNLTAAATDAAATVEGTGEKALNVGRNTFEIRVTCGKDSKTYTVEITRKAPDLSLAEVKVGDNLLTADGKLYIANVANDVTQVEIIATANNSAATVTGAGRKEGLVVGENRFDLTVSVGAETATYTVVVNRAGSSVKTVTSITVNGIAADYDADNTTYTVTIGKTTVDEVRVALTSEVSSYAFDEVIGTLSEGDNEFVFTVTAEDGTTAAYTLVIKVVLPMFRVSYLGNIEGAVANESYEYKYGTAQNITILLAAAYNKSYNHIIVTYTVGDGETKAVSLDGEYGFTVPADEAIGDIVVRVTGITLNTYTVTYHKDGVTTTETVEHGNAAQNAAITPDTSTKDVLDGYLYSHIENWVTEEGGMVTTDLSAVTADMDVYYKHEVIVRSEVAYYAPMGGAVTYYTIYEMNHYVAGDENGDVIFKVLIKSRATDGQAEPEDKTSFVIYGTATWNAANELGVAVHNSELNQWFTVKATAADKKVTVYRPDGSIAGEKVFESYAADTISLAIHADAAVAAVDPAVPDLCTVTYLDENGSELKKEKVIKGQSAAYAWSRSADDMGDGYAMEYRNVRWLDADGAVVALDNVASDITVRLTYDTYIIKNVTVKTDTNITAINRFAYVDENGIVSFRVRINNTGWAGFNVIATGGYVGISGGVAGGQTYIISINTKTGVITITTEDGTPKTLDMGNYNPTATSLANIKIALSDGDLDFAVVNADVVKVEYYDTDKTTLLYSEWIAKGQITYVHTFDADEDGYVKTVDTWLPIDGNTEKVYAAGGMTTKSYATDSANEGNGEIAFQLYNLIHKDAAVKDGKMEIYFTFKTAGYAGFMSTSTWTQNLSSYFEAGQTYKFVIEFNSENVGTVGTIYDQNGQPLSDKTNVDCSYISLTDGHACILLKTMIVDWNTPPKYATSGAIDVSVRW